MQNDSSHQDTPEFEKITPARIKITPEAENDSSSFEKTPQSNTQKKWLIMSFGLSAILAMAVFFMLPRVIEQPEIVKQEKVSTVPATQEISPWQEAQWAKERQQAQQVLEQLLDLQFELEELSVTLWAEQAFTKAAELAARGDDYYRNREFELAAGQYQDSFEMLQGIKASTQGTVEQQISFGFQLLDDGLADKARAAFELALKIQPGNARATNALKRATVLDQVLQLLHQAGEMEQQSNLDKANEYLQKAFVLDNESAKVVAAIAALNKKIAERDFSLAMSSGYRALTNNRLTDAKKQFGRAVKIKPESNEARTGIEQATNLIVQEEIAGLRAQAEQLIEQEKWSAAAKKYQAVLTLDANLVFAQEGLKNTGSRARLDGLLQQQLTDPQRLTSEEVYRESLQLLDIARTVADPGPRLAGQIQALKTMLKQAAEPVSILIESDDATDVTLYKVGHLGNFTRHELSLKPGSYVLVGKRVGYRDVRKEFVVSVDKTPGPISIRCEERI